MKNIFVLLILITSHLSLYSSDLDLSSTQIEFIKNHKKIEYVYDPAWKPFEWTSELETHVGMIYDILYIIEQKSNLNLVPVHVKTWPEAVDMLKKGTTSMVSAIGVTDKRKEYLTFSKNPLFKTPYVLVSRHGEDYLDGFVDASTKRVATIESSTIEEILHRQRKNVKFSVLKSVKDGFYALQNEDIDVFVVNAATAKYYINFLGFKNLKIAYKTNLTLDLRMAVRKDAPVEILEIIDKSIEAIDPKEIDNIFKKWTELKVQKELDWKVLFYILSGVFLLGSFLVVSNKKLHSMVNKQTGEINEQKQELEKLIESFDKHVIVTRTDLDGIITYASEAYCKVSGYTSEELIGTSHEAVRHPDTTNEFYEELWKTVKSDNIYKGEIKNLAKDGSCFWTQTIITPLYNKLGKADGYSAIRQNITDKKLIEELAITDGLTNIYNRRHFNDVFPKIIKGAKRSNELVAFLSIDIDFFKRYNDTYGHQKGDEALIKFANVLQNSLNRVDDKCFRLGGEEFCVLFKTSSKENALEFSKSIQAKVIELKIPHEKNLPYGLLTCSMGLVTLNAREIVSEDTMYKMVDDLLYEAKRNGRNQIWTN